MLATENNKTKRASVADALNKYFGINCTQFSCIISFNWLDTPAISYRQLEIIHQLLQLSGKTRKVICRLG